LPVTRIHCETGKEGWMALYWRKGFTFGDGTPLSNDEYKHLKKAHEHSRVDWNWMEGDVLVIDNHQVMHGRGPFEGMERRVAFCQTDAIFGYTMLT